MRERPILFSGPMVRAILSGQKTQTRRVVKPQPEIAFADTRTWKWHSESARKGFCHNVPADNTAGSLQWFMQSYCPYGVVGDRLWVRESFAGDDMMGALYRADFTTEEAAKLKTGELDDGEWCYRQWSPSIHMPRSVSRITLEITGVRVERLQDISGRDAAAEGMMLDRWKYDDHDQPDIDIGVDAEAQILVDKFQYLWDKINGKKHPWESNPFVWVVEFTKI